MRHWQVQYYGASKIRGVVAKTLGFLKTRAQGFQILTGPYFFLRNCGRGVFIKENLVENCKNKTNSVPHAGVPTDGSPCKMFCQRCGKSVGPTAAYSRHCGAPVVSADDADVVITAATTAMRPARHDRR